MKKKKNTLLWQLTKDGIDSYLFGTMHVTDFSVKPMIENLKPLLQKCQTYAAETDLDNPPSPDSDFPFLKNGSLFGRFGAKKFNKMCQIIAKAYKVDLRQMNSYKPLIVSSLLAKTVFDSTNVFGPDEYLWRLATELNLSRVGLEPKGREIEIMEKLPMKYQLNTLRAIASNVNKYRRKLKRLNQLYSEGDLEKLYRSTMKGSGGMKETLIYKRNVEMTQNLNSYALEAPIFAGVGAAHLPGRKGMLRLLKKEGFKLTPLDPMDLKSA